MTTQLQPRLQRQQRQQQQKLQRQRQLDLNSGYSSFQKSFLVLLFFFSDKN